MFYKLFSRLFGDINYKLLTEVKQCHLFATKELLNRGANVNAKDKDGKTPLMLAAVQDHDLIVRSLLENDADVNVKDKDGNTALMLAIEKEYAEIVELLKQAGAKE
jgi:ankyrin repeat protein